jgi:hypothetical protein
MVQLQHGAEPPRNAISADTALANDFMLGNVILPIGDVESMILLPCRTLSGIEIALTMAQKHTPKFAFATAI